MARTAKSTKTKIAKPTKAPARKASSPARRAAPAAKSPAKPKPVAASKQAKKVPAAKAPKLSVVELRTQLEKLERANATLRTKNREAGRAAKIAAARIAELEEQAAGLEKTLATKTAPAKSSPPAAGRTKRKSRQIDPGDAVPPGVAVEEPAPLDNEAETARENLETDLGGE